MADVFLSYARDDVGRAKALAALVERSGYSVWWDRDLEGGAEYSLEIDEALKSAAAVVVLWSKHSVGSAWVRDEAAAGRDTARLIPVRLDPSEPPLGFRQFQTIDLTRWNGRTDSAGVKTLKRAIAAKLGRKAGGVAPAVAADAPRRVPMAAVLAGLLILLALVGGYYWYARQSPAGVPAITIVSAASGADAARSAQLARGLSVDVGNMQADGSGLFELRESAGAAPKDVDYLVEVAASPAGAVVGADLSLLERQGRQILWTGHFEKPMAEQADLRPQAALSLRPILSCLAEASDGGLDLPTLKIYLRGCEKFADSVPGLVDEDQYTLLKQVVERAPRFAPALAHLALIEASADRAESARSMIARARAIDPKLAKTYLAETELQPREKWAARQAPLVEGIRVNPNAAALHSALAFELGQVGLRNDGIASGLRAIKLDPASPFIRLSYIQLLTYSGRLAEAEAEIVKAEKIWPTSKNVGDVRWAYDLRVGDARKALEKLRRDQSASAYAYTGTRFPEAAMLQAFLEARIDPTPANIEKTLEGYRRKVRLEPHLPGTMLLALATFDRIDEAYAILAHPRAQKAIAESSGLLFRATLKKFRQDPRFMPLAAQIGLVRYWTETGKWPDFCFEPDVPYDCKAEAARLKAAGKVR